MKYICFVMFLILGFSDNELQAQTISKEELTYLTGQWTGERFEDGRPKIPKEIIKRAKHIGLDDAWTVLKNKGYNNQFEGGWKSVNDTVIVTGRVVTAMYLPSRPDVEKSILERGHKEGKQGNTNSWPIDILVEDDVYVADGFGKIDGGTLIGSTLGNSIYSKSRSGVIFDGSARDLLDLKEISGFNAFVRDFHPSFLEGMILAGLNTPIRIGRAIVMPGDLVIGNETGILFIPAHLADFVVSTCEFINMRDEFGFEMVRSGKYSTGEIDSQWGDALKDHFLEWVKEHPEFGKMTRERLDEIMRDRTW